MPSLITPRREQQRDDYTFDEFNTDIAMAMYLLNHLPEHRRRSFVHEMWANRSVYDIINDEGLSDLTIIFT